MHKLLLLALSLLNLYHAAAQDKEILSLRFVNAQKKPLPNVTAEVLNKDSFLLKIGVSDSFGIIQFNNLASEAYILRISSAGYNTSIIQLDKLSASKVHQIVLNSADKVLQNIVIVAPKPFIELRADKTVVNFEAGIANVGTTAMEALEKLPGITIDKDGNISLKGRPGVTLMIDGKLTYLNAGELATLLNGMSASQISQVELIDNPTAKYDAAGNAGIINIKLKKNIQHGFNGNIIVSLGQGVYPKNNNNVSLNYQQGKFNVFMNYSLNISRNFSRLYALRTYFKNDGVTIASLLEQPTFIKGDGSTHNLRSGIDYTITPKTSLSFILSGFSLQRKSNSNNTARWMSKNRVVDSLITTRSDNNTAWDNAGATVNFKHSFTEGRKLTADFDVIGYRIRGDQFFENNSALPIHYSEVTKANIPTDIQILSAKADYSEQLKTTKIEGGWKSSNITTDNLAAYQLLDGGLWKEDLGRSNHFIYEENIHAFYGTTQTQLNKWLLQGGLRYELTSYSAKQLGNAIVRDSSFSRRYNSLFPSLFISFEKDSFNTFSLTAGRRIDRPAFQKLNPFLYIINKYTYEKGNPYYRPQYTWNIELNYLYKGILNCGINYSLTTDYFSQIFPLDSNGIVIYTEGNLGQRQNLGLSAGFQSSILPWWSLSLQTELITKKMQGVIERRMKANITQYSINLNNQLRFKKGWSGELSGFYNSSSQEDIQEIVDPAGQLSIGISRSVLKDKGILKFALRDIFYTNWMKGLTSFNKATEYFKITRDTRMATVSFTYRFGKLFKTGKQTESSAGEEIERVGNG
jgi:hypothetical protein